MVAKVDVGGDGAGLKSKRVGGGEKEGKRVQSVVKWNETLSEWVCAGADGVARVFGP